MSMPPHTPAASGPMTPFSLRILAEYDASPALYVLNETSCETQSVMVLLIASGEFT